MDKDYLERGALMDFANNHVGSTIDANDVARFPAADVVEMKWIPVEEETPPELTDVLVHYECGDIEVNCRFTKRGFIGEETYGKVTHWMPLPAPPVMGTA